MRCVYYGKLGAIKYGSEGCKVCEERRDPVEGRAGEAYYPMCPKPISFLILNNFITQE